MSATHETSSVTPPDFLAFPKSGDVSRAEQSKYTFARLKRNPEKHASDSERIRAEREAKDRVRKNVDNLLDDPERKFATKLINAIIDKKNDSRNVSGLTETERKLIEIFSQLPESAISQVVQEQMAKISASVQVFIRGPLERKRGTTVSQEEIRKILPTASGIEAVVRFLIQGRSPEVPGSTHELYLNSYLDDRYKIDVVESQYHMEGDRIIIDDLRLVQVKGSDKGGSGIETSHQQFLQDFFIVARKQTEHPWDSFAFSPEMFKKVDKQLTVLTSDIETSYIGYLEGKLKMKKFEEKVVQYCSDVLYKNRELHLFNNLPIQAKVEALERCFFGISIDIEKTIEKDGDELMAEMARRLPDIIKRVSAMVRRQESRAPRANLLEPVEIKQAESVIWSPGKAGRVLTLSIS